VYTAASVDELYRGLSGELDALAAQLVDLEGRAAASEARAAQLDSDGSAISTAAPRLYDVLDMIVRGERTKLDRTLHQARLQAAAERDAADAAAERILEAARVETVAIVGARFDRGPVAPPGDTPPPVAVVEPGPASGEPAHEAEPTASGVIREDVNEQFWREEREATGARVLARTSMYTLAQAAAVLLLVTLVLVRVG
jgi:hypothetical protein